MVKLLFAILLILETALLYGREIVLISDVDDTLKRTHVLGNFSGGASFDNDFTGLNTLYQILACRKNIGDIGADQPCIQTIDEADPEQTGVYYVTAAPSFLNYWGRKFLKKNKFPEGNFYYKPDWGDSTYSFKVETIAEILKDFYDDEEVEVVLIGDNGEKDPAVFETISQQFQNSKFKISTYIHLVYAYAGSYKEIGVKPKAGQKMYLTAVDLALDFYLKDWIYTNDLMMVYYDVMEKLNSSDSDEVEKVIPGWMKCHEFFDDFNKPQVTNHTLKMQLDIYYNTLMDICHKRSLTLD